MSIKKIALSFALAGILGATSMVAETDGVFVGVQAGYGGLTLKNEYKNSFDPTENVSDSTSTNGFRYGFVLGYKTFFNPQFDIRYYAAVDLGTDYEKDLTDTDGDKATLKINSYNITANADVLYNFISDRDLDFGGFVGLGLGYANHKIKVESVGGTLIESVGGNAEKTLEGFDLGINLGLRANIAYNHSIELYSRFSILPQEEEIERTYPGGLTLTNTHTVQQPYQVGLRYIFSF